MREQRKQGYLLKITQLTKVGTRLGTRVITVSTWLPVLNVETQPRTLFTCGITEQPLRPVFTLERKRHQSTTSPPLEFLLGAGMASDTASISPLTPLQRLEVLLG